MSVTELITPETISEITSQLWCAVVPEHSALEQIGTAPALLAQSEELTARVEISGSFEGAVELSCSMAVARAVASAMFCVGEHDLDEASIQDAVGELANIVGGNVKSLLPPPTLLSLPVVWVSNGGGSGGGVCEVGFVWMAEPVLVRVHEHSPAAAP